MAEIQRVAELIFLGDFNVDMEGTYIRERDENITEEIAIAGLENLVRNFLLRQQEWCKYCRMWVIVRQERLV